MSLFQKLKQENVGSECPQPELVGASIAGDLSLAGPDRRYREHCSLPQKPSDQDGMAL